MYGTTLKTICTAAAVAVATATASFAATYDATNVTTGNNDHTFYFGSAPFGGGNKHWQFEGGMGLFETFTDGFAKVTGTIFQNAPQADAANRFDVDVTFKLVDGPMNGLKCGGGCADSANWDHYVFDDATLTGIAGAVSGLVLGLDNRPNMPIGQFGNGANDKNAGLGFSDWFKWSVETANGHFGLMQGDSGYGDINLNLADNGGGNRPLNPVPLPAGGLLLLSGLAGVGAMRKFKKR